MELLLVSNSAAFIYFRPLHHRVCRITPANHRGHLAATELHPDMTVWQGLGVEIWLTFNLVLTVHGCTYPGRKENTYMFTIPIGMAVSVAVLSGVSEIYSLVV